MTTDTATFDRILNLEAAVRLTSACAAFRGAGVPDFAATRQDDSLSSDKAKLFAAVDALTPAQMVAFGAYRVAATQTEES